MLRRANARHHILALRIDQIFAVKFIFAGGRVARKGHAGGAVLAHIAKHHGLHIDRRAPIIGNGVNAAIGARARAIP